uniref:Uncharacterized protein n=1 Tax=Octopus bimaculoides TaxID=37653 RepID=A0A0L8GBA6_OCTBM
MKKGTDTIKKFSRNVNERTSGLKLIQRERRRLKKKKKKRIKILKITDKNYQLEKLFGRRVALTITESRSSTRNRKRSEFEFQFSCQHLITSNWKRCNT